MFLETIVINFIAIFSGNKVQITHGLETTVAEFEALDRKEQQKVRRSFIQLYENAPFIKYLMMENLSLPMQGLVKN